MKTTINEKKAIDVKRVLVVGSWAKEQITIENIKTKPVIQVFAFLDTRNPGILSVVDGYKIGSLHDIEAIVRYAKETHVDLVLITTASPLSSGVVNALEAEGIMAFGPTKNNARLESDKGFMRALMKEYHIHGLPKFRVFKSPDAAVEYAKQLKWNVAVKPIGLTEGLGVRVYGDQLRTSKEVISYIQKIFKKKIGGASQVLIEEKVHGEEFTIQSFVNGKSFIPTPAVQDFKKLLPGDTGPNTASMGSYSDAGSLLPFMTPEDYRTAVNIMKETLEALQQKTGEICRGFLYGQFILTADGIKVLEYNFRPGDPEWLNIVSILEENIIDIIVNLLEGKQIPLHFNNNATVCKYLVPKRYPKTLNEEVRISVDERTLRQMGVKLFYSAGYDDEGILRNGSERGIALVAEANTISAAAMILEQAIEITSGDFYYRKDIGTKELIDSKIRKIRSFTSCPR